MDWDGLRQRLRNELESLWARIQESPATQQLREKYESLNPRTQKLVFGTLISGALFLIVWSPIATWWSSQDALQSFENRRALIRQMFTLSKESQSLTPLPPAPDDASLKDLYRNALLEANLGESQITQIETSAQVLDSLPAAVLRSVLDVKLASLNLRQVTEIGHLLQGLNPSVR